MGTASKSSAFSGKLTRGGDGSRHVHVIFSVRHFTPRAHRGGTAPRPAIIWDSPYVQCTM